MHTGVFPGVFFLTFISYLTFLFHLLKSYTLFSEQVIIILFCKDKLFLEKKYKTDAEFFFFERFFP